MAYTAPYGQQTSANGVRAGMWVCTSEHYSQKRREYRAQYGSSPYQLQTPYQLVLATYQLGNQQVVAFSDGTSAIWYATRNVIVEDCSEIAALRDYGVDAETGEVANALEEIIRFLDDRDTAESFLNIAANQAHREPQTLAHALMVAMHWNMITVAEVPGFGISEAEHHDAPDMLIRLRHAGEDWQLASSELQPIRKKGRRAVGMDPSEQPSPSIHIGTFAGIFNVGRNISGQHTAKVRQSQISDAEILSGLKEIVESQIPWSDYGLYEVRGVIERAVVQENPRMPGLKKAMLTLGRVCGDILKGMLSNGAYQVMMHFIS